jgi:hypothetical protein
VAAFIYLCGCLAALVYAGSVVVLTQQGVQLWPALTANPLWLLIAVVACGLGRLVQTAGQVHALLRRLEGWKSAEDSTIAVRGPSLMEVLEQIRDRAQVERTANPSAVESSRGTAPLQTLQPTADTIKPSRGAQPL